jgi:hypothetical protein
MVRVPWCPGIGRRLPDERIYSFCPVTRGAGSPRNSSHPTDKTTSPGAVKARSSNPVSANDPRMRRQVQAASMPSPDQDGAAATELGAWSGKLLRGALIINALLRLRWSGRAACRNRTDDLFTTRSFCPSVATASRR